MPPQSTYLIKPGTSAEQLAEQRQAAINMLAEASSTAPVQHWAQILGQTAKGGLSGWEIGEAQREGRRSQDEAGGLFAEAFASLGGSNRVPGALAAPGASVAAEPASPARAAAGAAGRQDQMAPTNDILDTIRQEEGFAPIAKWDVRQHSGGYGSKAAPGERFDRMKAEQYLQRDAGPVMQWVNTNAPQASDLQKRALVSFGYNLGVDDLEKLKPDIQRGDWNRVGERMLSFNNALNEKTGRLEPLAGLTARRGREAAMIRGGGGPVSIAAPETDDERQNALIQKLYRNEQTRPIATALFSAKLAKDKDKKRHVVAPGASLVDDNGNPLFQAPAEDATAKARQQAIGKGQGEARLAIPAAVSRAGETVGILEKLRNHPGLDAGTGATSLVASRIPGSDAYDFEQLRQQAQGTAFLTAIGEMRGTGAISNVEGEAATQAVGRMKSAQSKEAFLEALGDYERVVRTGVINTYRNAGLEVPPELMAPATRSPSGGAPSAAPGAPSSAPGSAAPAARPASGAIKAPDGLQEGITLRDSESGELMTVRGGMLVPAAAAAPVAAARPADAGPMSPARGSAAAAGNLAEGAAPTFKGPWTSDRRTLLESPTPQAMAAFDQMYGRGKAQEVIARSHPGTQRPMNRGSYLLRQ